MFHVPSCMYKDWRTLLSFKFSMQPNIRIEDVLFKQLFVCIIDLPRTCLYASCVRSTLSYVWRILHTLFCMHEECFSFVLCMKCLKRLYVCIKCFAYLSHVFFAGVFFVCLSVPCNFTHVWKVLQTPFRQLRGFHGVFEFEPTNRSHHGVSHAT